MTDQAIMLGEPARIAGDVTISFRGTGRARFRIQHTRDDGGEPDPLGWCDVSQICNADIADPMTAVGRDSMVPLLVDTIDGDRDIRYRRYKADWLRVLPGDEEDEAMVGACARYAITIMPCGEKMQGRFPQHWETGRSVGRQRDSGSAGDKNRRCAAGKKRPR
jgi:hypothetical protein